MPDPKKKPTLPFWQQHLSKLDANKDGITSGREILLGAKQGFKAWRNIASNIGAPGTISGSNISTGAKAIKNNASAIGHTTLDVAGMAPVVGAGADAINASWYASQGDTTNAALSSAALIPGAGQFVTGGKYVAKLRKLFGFGKNASKNVPNPKSPVTETSFKSKNTTPLKELPHEGLINSEKLTSVINRSKSKGVIYDQNLKNFDWKPDMFRKMPDVGRRKMVDVNPGGGIPPQRFYQSRGWGDKGVDELGRSKNKPGHWTPIEGFGTNSGTKDWFIKAEGWDKGYGSEVFKNMGTNIKKMGY